MYYARAAAALESQTYSVNPVATHPHGSYRRDMTHHESHDDSQPHDHDQSHDEMSREQKRHDQLTSAPDATEADAAPRIEVSEHEGNTRIDILEDAAVRPRARRRRRGRRGGRRPRRHRPDLTEEHLPIRKAITTLSDMENDFSGPPPRPTSAEAREALDRLNQDGEILARRVVTPWWYHVGLAAIIFTMIASQALPGVASITLVALAIVAIPVLTLTYSRLYGISTSYRGGPRSTRILIATIAVLAIGMVSALAIKTIGASPWWVLIPAGLAALATVILGRRYDDMLRAELARTTDGAA